MRWPLLVVLAAVCTVRGQQASRVVRPAAELRETGAAPAARVARFLRGRVLASGAPAAQAMVAARVQHTAMIAEQRALLQAHPELASFGAMWQSMGPAAVQSLSYGAVSGRVTSIAVDPGDPSGNTVYIGASGGGGWKSTNAMAGSSAVQFAPLTDTLPVFSANAGSSAIPSLSIGALSVQPGGVVLAGTGDANDSSDSYYGGGILRSADGGVTWTLIPGSRDGLYGNHSFVGLGFAGFAWSTTTPSLVVAAVSQSAEGVLVNAPDSANSVMGLYASTDAGVTWQMATIEDGGHVVQSPLPNGGNNGGNAATAVVWNPVRQRFFAAVRFHGYYESVDGMTWTRLAVQPSAGLTTIACPAATALPGSAACPIFRGALAVDAVSGDLFALTVDAQNHDGGLVRDMCGRNGGAQCQAAEPSFGSAIVSTAIDASDGSGTIAQGDYNLALTAVPSSGDTVLFVGTHDLFRCSVAAGCVLRNTTNTANGCNAPARVAPAEHAIAAASGGLVPGVFFGNDSGLWRSTDLVNQQASVCSDDDAAHFQNLNGALGSLADVVSFAEDPANAGVLLAGLGAAGTAATGGSGWTQLSAGEGGTVAIDPVNSALWYLTTAAGISIERCAMGAACSAADVAAAATIGPTAVALDDARLDAPWLLDPADGSQLLAGTCRVWRGPAADGSVWSGANVLSPMFAGPQSSRCNATDNPLVRSLAAGGTPTATTTSPVVYAGMAGLLSGGGTIAGHVFTTATAGTASAATPWIDRGTSPVANDAQNQQQFNPGGFDISSVTVDPHDASGQTVYVTVMGFSGNGVSVPHLYRSSDGGAHWTNITSNLPNAPANSVAVDPNDANTVYVALDTGVYATSAVAGCASANCWTVFGTALPNAPAIQLAAGAALPTGDGRRGELRVATAGRGVWEVPLLTSMTDSQAVISVNPAALGFAAQPVGTLSAAETVSVTNSGAAPLTISRVTATGDFQAATVCAGSTIAVGASCAVTVEFLPTAMGARTGVFTVYGNVLGGQVTVALSGVATPASPVTLSPVVLPFPTTTIGASSAAENILVANTGSSTVTLAAPTLSGDYKIAANTCGASLAASTGCTVSIVFAPRAAGARTGLFSIVSGAGTLTAALSGTATAPPTDTLSAIALSFGPQTIGGSSAPQGVVLTNAGDQPLTLITGAITAGDFSVVNSCGNSLAGHSTCTIDVLFGPSRLGAQTGSLVVSDEFRSQTVALNGTGLAPPGVSLSPANALSFTATPVGTSSATQMVTLTNNGGAAITVKGVSLTGDFALASGSTCGGTVAAGSACSFAVVFTPTATGARTGTLTVSDSSPTSPHILNLSGSGLDFTVAADGQTSATVASGTSAAFPMLVSSGAGVSGSATITCTGAPANSSCVLSPAGVTFNGGTTLVVATVATGVAPAAAQVRNDRVHTDRGYGAAVWLAAVLPCGLLLWRGGRGRRWPGLLMLVVILGGVSGCGSSRTVPPTGTGSGASGATAVSPPGTYTIAVVVTSGALSREVDFTLTVQ